MSDLRSSPRHFETMFVYIGRQLYIVMGVYAHIMNGTLIGFTVPTGKDKTRSSAFAKAFYGQDTSSHQGKYKYHRHGLLDDIPHNKLIRGVIIVQNNDVEKVTEFLTQHSAHYRVRVVELTKDDCSAMGLQT